MSWIPLSSAMGSNEGGLYRAPDGRRQQVKFMDDEHLVNELLAIRLQETAGVLVPHARVQRVNGRKAQTSPMVPVRVAEPGQKLVKPSDQIKNMGMHIYLGNWDALTAGNYGYIGTNVILIDAGGSMRFRAMGQSRNFTSDVPEWEAFQSSSKQSWLFKVNPKDAFVESALNVLTLSDATLDAVVEAAFSEAEFNDEALRKFYKDVLKKRKLAIRDKLDAIV